MLMASRGRNRKSLDARKPSGRLAKALTDVRGPIIAHRIREMALNKACDPALGTPFGRMFINYEISAAQYDAATKFAALRAAADRADGLPPRNPAALNFNRVQGLPIDAVGDPENDAAIIEAYYAAADAIGKTSRELSAVIWVVVEQREPAGFEHKRAMIDGLARLVTHWKVQK